MRRVFLCGYYGYGNAGDEALLATLLAQLPSCFTPVVLSGNPPATAHLYGVATCDRRRWGQVLHALRRSEVFIWGGGSLIQDVTSWRSPLYYLGLMTLAQQLGCRTVAWAQGIGPLRSPFYRWWLRQLLRRCVAVTVRDSGSAALLRQWQIPHQQGADPVWFMESAAAPGFSKRPLPTIAVSLRPHPSLTPERLSLLARALHLWQEQAGVEILLLPFQPQQDLPLAEAISQTLVPSQTRLLCLEDPRQIKGILAQVQGAIAMRLHALIMAASVGCPCFALSYDPKVSHLMTDTGMAGCELTALPDSPHTLVQHWQQSCQTPQISSDNFSYLNSAKVHQRVLEELR